MNGITHPYSRVTIISHMIVGAISATAALAVSAANPFVMLCMVLACTLLAAHLASRYCGDSLAVGLELIEHCVISNEKPGGNTVFHQTADKLVTHVSRLAAAAAKGREQSREVEEVLAAFDRRGSRDSPLNPSRQLSLLLESLGKQSQTTIESISTIDADLQALHEQMISAAHDEFELVKSAAGEIRNVAKDVADISELAKQAKSSEDCAAARSECASRQLFDLYDQLEQLREQINTHDKKTDSLRDQLSEVAAFMETIHEYATKTDTLALNASIESVRAGEHGLAFAAAADEFRKMTGVISSSTQDAMDRFKLIDECVHDAATMYAQRHTTVEGQMVIVRELNESLSEIRQSHHESRMHLDRLLETTDSELRNLNLVAGSLGGAFESAERTATHVEEDLRVSSQLKDRLSDLSNLLSPLLGDRQPATPHTIAISSEPQPSPVMSHE